MTSAAEREIARIIAGLSRETRALARASQAAHRSVEITDGPVTYYDEDGMERLLIGPQGDDGVFTVQEVNGPVPPQPTDPTVVPVTGGVTITYDGTYEEASIPPDFSHTEVHVSSVPDYVADDSTQIATFPSPLGGQYFYAIPESAGPRYYSLVAVTKSLTESIKSLEVEATGGALPGGTDGEGPPSSPTPEVIPGLGAFYLRWAPPVNADPIRFEVHVSGDQVAGTAFVPSADTLYTETSAYSATVRNLPITDEETEEVIKFNYTDDYYFKVVAFDDDDAAAASPGVAAKLTQITGPDIAANTIVGENIVGETLTGNLFSGTILLGSTISTGAIDPVTGLIVGARVELGPDGLTNFDSTGDPIIQFPLSGSLEARVKAHMEILSAEVENNFTLKGTNNQIAPNGAFYLSNGVVAPKVPPASYATWDSTALDTSESVSPHPGSVSGSLGTFKFNPSQARSIVWDPFWNSWIVVQQKSGGFRVWRFLSAGGVYLHLGDGEPWVDDYPDRTLASAAVNETGGYATLYKMGTDWWVWAPEGINHIPDGWILDEDTRPPVIGYDGVADQWFLAQSDGGADGRLHVRRFTVNAYSGSGAFPNASSVSVYDGPVSSGNSRRINGVYFGPAIHGSTNRYGFSFDEWTNIEVYATGGTRRNTDGTYEEWDKPGPMLGFCYDGTTFCTLDATGIIIKYSNWTWTALSDDVWLGLAAYDSDAAGTGMHETPVGGLTKLDLRRRAKLAVVLPKTNDSGGADDPDKWRLYWSRQVAKPTTGAMVKLAATAGDPAVTTTVTLTADPTGAAAPGGIDGTVSAVNNFPAGNPAVMYSTATDGDGELIELRGDGAGRVGPLWWDTSSEITRDSGSIGASGNFTGNVRVIRIGQMCWITGGVGRASGFQTSMNPIGAVLPAEFRPSGNRFGPGCIAHNSTSTYQFQVASDGTVNVRQSGAITIDMQINMVYYLD